MYKLFAGLAILFLAVMPFGVDFNWRRDCNCGCESVKVTSDWSNPENAWQDIVNSGAYDVEVYQKIGTVVTFMLSEDNADFVSLRVYKNQYHEGVEYASLTHNPSAWSSVPPIGARVCVCVVDKYFEPVTF